MKENSFEKVSSDGTTGPTIGHVHNIVFPLVTETAQQGHCAQGWSDLWCCLHTE